jgi:hypothetical protein
MNSPAQVAYVQGVQTNDTVVDPLTFAQFTRRTRFPMKSAGAIGGLGTSDNVQLKKTGVISALEVRVAGSVVIGGTIGTTTMSYEWPYNLVKAFKMSVNGQSTLIDTRGLDLKFADIALDHEVTDKGVDQRYGNATAVGNGTFSLSHEDWGGTGAASNYMAPGLNVAAIATYPIELTYVVPVAADQVNLVGSVFGQSQATNINLEIVYSTQAELFSAVGGSATVSFSAVTIDVTGVAYSIPVVNGKATVPDLSQLHGVNTFMNPLTASGDTEINLPGTGQGRKLLRLWWNAYSSATPLVMNATNYGNVAYKYGSNTVPEILPNGSKLRALNERQTNSDVGKCWGYGLWDFAGKYALRDVIDLGTTSDFRLMVGLVSTPTNGKAFVTQETLYAAAIGA